MYTYQMEKSVLSVGIATGNLPIFSYPPLVLNVKGPNESESAQCPTVAYLVGEDGSNECAQSFPVP